MKLYQNALRLHSQGPPYYRAADEAYKALFASEIFTYPEALPAVDQLDRFVDDNEDDDDDSVIVEPAMPISGNDVASSSLPQILYLSYKNYGQFCLDDLIHRLKAAPHDLIQSNIHTYKYQIANIAWRFAQALERDDTDLDLWRKLSGLCDKISSKRISRLCLESVLDEEDGLQDPLNLEIRLALDKLNLALTDIQDEVSLGQLESQSKPVSSIPSSLKQRMELASALPQLTKSSPGYGYENVPYFKQNFPFAALTWAEVGKCLLHRLDFNLLNPAANFGECFTFSHPSLNDSVPSQLVPSDVTQKKSVQETIGPLISSTQLGAQSSGQVVVSEENQASGAVRIAPPISSEQTQQLIERGGPQLPLEQSTADSSTQLYEDAVEFVQDSQSAPAPEAPENATISLPTRKRTSESAGLPDPGDGGREKSRRIRARAEGAEEENAAVELLHSMTLQLETYGYKDQQLFDHVNRCLSKLGRHSDYNLSQLKSVFSGPANPEHKVDTAMQDFKHSLTTWDQRRSVLFAQGRSSAVPNSHLQTKESGLEMFLEYSKKPISKSKNVLSHLEQEGLISFLRRINSCSSSLDAVAIAWVLELLCVRPICGEKEASESQSSSSFYLSSPWSENLKQTVVHVLVKWDEQLFSYFTQEVVSNEDHALTADTDIRAELDGLTEVLQAIFEIHLDIYGSITNPSSKIHQSTRAAQRHILLRWSQITYHVMNRYKTLHGERGLLDDSLQLRYLWAVVTHMSLSTEHSREYITQCYEDLRETFSNTPNPKIELQNNAVMPELSLDAIDRELSTLRTMDFFLKMFDRERGNPVSVIETLEPILLQFPIESLGETLNEQDQQKELIRDFLCKAGSSSRMLLWHKLRTAYEEIDYPPMVFLCDLKVLQMLLGDLSAPDYLEDMLESRVMRLVGLLHDVDTHLTKAVLMAVRDDVSCFDCLDEENLHLALETCEQIIFLLHIVALWEDSVRVGQTISPPQSGAGSTNAFESALARMRAMYVKAWLLQYTLLKEAISQNRAAFPEWKEDLTDLLDLVHRTLGMRQYCNVSKKMFLHFARTELSALNSSEVSDMPMGQVVFDLYGFKVCSQTYLLEDHGCGADRIDKRATLEILDFVMKQSEGVQVKDLFKTDFRSAFEKMQAAVGSPKPDAAQVLNAKLLSSYFKSPVNPQDLFRCIKGIGSLPCRKVESFQATIASKGLFYVMGHITLAKFRSQKRVSPGSTEDLDVAIALLEMDLKFDTEKWETWHRLGQAYDAKLEEDTLFKADKLNNNMPELITLQRKAIKCYTMAVAIAMRTASAQSDTVSKLSELFADFGLRIYASSRQPFSMQVFGLGDAVRHYNNELNTMYTKRPFRELQLQSAWSFAAELFRQSLLGKPKSWFNWYMRGKCLSKLRWMMGDSNDDLEMIDAFTKAVECVPEKRDSRHPEKDPILEPHYKLVSTIHKLVKDGALEPAEGCEYMQATFYACKVASIDDRDEWETYILSVLKSLRNADKSNWHHRFVARAAHVLYDDSINDPIAPYAAKHELTQQIFTKTMTIQVWRPEYERAGRHFVYTGRYVEFFVELLRKTNDRANIEALAKRIRKRASDFVDHGRIWDVVCTAYSELLRRHCQVPPNHEDVIFKAMPFPSFQKQTALLEEWVQRGGGDDGEHPLLSNLREAVELKKLNAGLKKDTLVDDLIGDIVARLYETIVPGFMAEEVGGAAEIRSTEEEVALVEPTPFPIASQLGISVEEHAEQVRQYKEDLKAKEKLKLKVITKKEIQRRAEALVSKPAPNIFPTSMPVSNAAAPTSYMANIQVVVASHRTSQPPQTEMPPTPPPALSASPSRDPDAELLDAGQDQGQDLDQTRDPTPDPDPDPDLEPEANENTASPRDVPSSVPGSVHDSADDESELSEIDEDEEEILEGASLARSPQPTAVGTAPKSSWWGDGPVSTHSQKNGVPQADKRLAEGLEGEEL